ncbi:Hemolysin-type calcium-binding repeat-containing protein [Roseivivax marinus]|uniref:calcium-binding protein n=1 Tax=Roseivivax marinus TaxID=1379903 RepID=UPI0008D39FD5|nr:calcium-binding protein [Roseivivax marinus]SEL91847.1 Hemolysin-type calcium-binding repeat-containing protein [Roseivivax marinus]
MVNTVIVSTAGDDRLEGGQNSADYIDGGPGNDTIIGNDGADWLIGNLGDDVVFAGAGDTDLDIVQGDDGNDELYGGGGGDFIDGGAGDDTMAGGTGNDVLIGETGAFSLDFYSAFEQVLSGVQDGEPPVTADDFADFSSALQVLQFLNFGGTTVGIDDNFLNSFNRADAGDDDIWGGSGKDFILGSIGDDEMGGGSGNDTINGGRDDDTIYGSTGEDDLTGGDEDDLIFGGDDNDVIGGDGNIVSVNLVSFIEGETDEDDGNGDDDDDTNDSSSRADLLADSILTPDGDGESDSIVFSDYEGDDEIYGGNGDDIIDAHGGSDTIWGGAGNDVMSAGSDDAGTLTPDNETDILGFIAGHGMDDVFDFGVNEYPESVNGAEGAENFANREDIIWLVDGEYDGEFGDAVSAGIITREGQNADTMLWEVTIDTSGFGYAGGDMITIHFDSEDEMNAFAGDNIVVGDDFLVSETLSFLGTDGFTGDGFL